ncbi:MAG: DUF1667 domain-containing protein [Spirochaetes bacterium]|nr:DUF1667 domain-containing protein [Spirochaetota bacterium]
MTQSNEITCILCPQGCTLFIDLNTQEVSGNKCKKGIDYGITEITNPTRTLTTTIKTIFADFPRLSVKTDQEIPLSKVFIYMKEINQQIAQKRYQPGDIIVTKLCNSEVNLIATDNMGLEDEN